MTRNRAGRDPATATGRRRGDQRGGDLGFEATHRPATAAGRRRGDRGQVAGVEVLPFGLLVFVSAVLVLANAWGVVDAKLAVTAAAREAVRAYVESPEQSGATAAARGRALAVLADYGRSDPENTVDVAVSGGSFRRCARVTVTVSHPVPVVAVPFTGGFGRLDPVAAAFTELIDPFRSGLPGEAQC